LMRKYRSSRKRPRATSATGPCAWPTAGARPAASFFVGAHGAHALFLDYAQQLDLHGEGQVGDFVEEQRAALGRLEQAQLVATGAGEAALDMPEELALDQFRRGWHRSSRRRRGRRRGARGRGCAAPRVPCRVPDSPWMCTGAWLRASLSICAAQLPHRLRIADQLVLSGALVGTDQPSPVRARLTRLRSFSRPTGLLMKSKAPALRARMALSTLPCAVIMATGSSGYLALDVLHQLDTVAIRQAHVREAQTQSSPVRAARGFGEVRGAHGLQTHARSG
jgi:hypothetical protein